MISRYPRYLSPKLITILVNAYVHSVTDYCLTLWGPARQLDFKDMQSKVNNLIAIYAYPSLSKFYNKLFWKSQSLQNNAQAARIQCKSQHKNVNHYELLERFNLLTLNERLSYYTIWNLFKIKKTVGNVIKLDEIFERAELGLCHPSQFIKF